MGVGLKPPFRKRNHEGGVSSALGHLHEWEKESCSLSAITNKTKSHGTNQYFKDILKNKSV